ncbi:alpha/beta fold hydrolase [Streptomyces sp. NPDC001595]|uniref:alpha/beta fold hydrolase n=1 Tax=Streptomyces sp. NPDC001532 TaxID=3154520 RepID=UPI00331B7B0A
MSTKGPGTRTERARSVVVDGARVACWESGPADGEPVLMLHGYPANHACWRHQVPALARDHRVITPDLLGWGRSERPTHLRYDYDTEVARIGRLLDALDCPSVSLVGHDYGGFLSLGFAQTQPGRVRRLALLNSRAHASFVPRWKAAFGLTTAVGRTPGLRTLAERFPFGAQHRRSLGPLVDRGYLDEEVLEDYVGWMDTAEGRRWLLHYFADYRVEVRPELRRRLGDIGCPTAVVWGRDDAYLSPSIALELARDIPGAELTMFDDAGHWVMDERPAQVSAALRTWLSREA